MTLGGSSGLRLCPLEHPPKKAELIAVPQALERAKGEKITIYTDGRYAFGTVHIQGPIYKYMEFRKMAMTTLYARQEKRHRCVYQTFGLRGRGRGWDDLGEWHPNMYTIM